MFEVVDSRLFGVAFLNRLVTEFVGFEHEGEVGKDLGPADFQLFRPRRFSALCVWSID
jgi:hypothetical protein